MRTADAVAEFLADCRYSGLSPNTISAYTWALKKLAEGFPDELPDDPRVVRRFMGTHEDLSPESRFDVWRHLCRLWRWLGNEHDIANVMVDDSKRPPRHLVPAPRRPRRMPRTLEDYEITHLLEKTEDRRDRAMIGLILDTGMRIGELATLTWPDVMSSGVRVHGKTGQRFVPMSPEGRRLILGLGDVHHIWVGRRGPMTQTGCEQAIRRAMHRAGFRPPKAGPHMLRHTFGRQYITLGGDVFHLQRILGHTSVTMTMLYVSLSTRDLEVNHAKYSPLRARANDLRGRQLRLLDVEA